MATYARTAQKIALACRVRAPQLSKVLLPTFPDFESRLDSCTSLTREQCIELLASGLFSPDYYLRTHHDVFTAGADPLEHFLKFGLAEGRNPNPLFHSEWYLNENPDVRAAHISAFLHYFLFGRHEGRAGSPYFNHNYYLAQYPHILSRGIDPLAHFLHLGAFRGARPNPHFDTSWYAMRYNAQLSTRENPLIHYIEHGAAQGHKPSEDFDAEWYRRYYGGDIRHGASPLADLVCHPVWERRQGSEQGLHKLKLNQANGFGRLTPKKRKGRLALGIVTFCNSEIELTRLWRSIVLATKNLADFYNISVHTLENGTGSSWPVDASSIIVHENATGNCGFGRGHNRLLHAVFAEDSDFYLAVNPDGFLHPDCLSALLAMSEAHDHRALIEALQFPQEHPKVYDFQTFETPWASGACLLISRHVYARIGGFDPHFFMYCEDVDYSWTAHRMGIQVLTCPRALFFHDMSGRVTTDALLTRFLQSGLYLGQKWQNAKFCEGVQRTAQAHHLTLEASPPPLETYIAPKGSTFDYGFSFSPVRWQVHDCST